MTLTEVIRQYLDDNFGGRLMLDVDGKFTVYNDNEEILPVLTRLFEEWAIDNEDEFCRDNPINLFAYCRATHSFGGICTLYYEDCSGDFCLEKPW